MIMEELNVLYEDNHVIVVCKPQNIPVQADASEDLDMLTMVKNYVKEKYNKPGEAYIGLVHRLDRPTGGVMVFARTSKAAARLCEAIKSGDMEKTYLTVVCGTPREKQAYLTHYLKKNEKTNTVMVVPQTTEGAKKAELSYRVLESKNGVSLLSVDLITGRSHQIRVQMATIGTPLYADVKYGGEKAIRGSHLALWATELKFTHPTTGKRMTFRVFPPENQPFTQFDMNLYLGLSIKE